MGHDGVKVLRERQRSIPQPSTGGTQRMWGQQGPNETLKRPRWIDGSCFESDRKIQW